MTVTAETLAPTQHDRIPVRYRLRNSRVNSDTRIWTGEISTICVDRGRRPVTWRCTYRLQPDQTAADITAIITEATCYKDDRWVVVAQDRDGNTPLWLVHRISEDVDKPLLEFDSAERQP